VGQVRAAARLADDLGALGPRLRLVVDHALRTSKHARSATSIGAGGAGIGSAVASVVADKAGPRARVALIGAGDAASVIARELTKRLDAQLIVVNRSIDRAESLAARHGGRAASMEALAPSLAEADVVVTAVAGHQPVVTPGVVRGVRALRSDWAPVIIDAGLPRNVDPACGLPVTTMESLAERAQRVTRLRADAVTEVERHIDAGLSRWHAVELERLIRHGIDRLDAPADLAS
jgi:glutamyl-tRNA reductase